MQAQVIAAEGEQKASQALKEVRTMLLFFYDWSPIKVFGTSGRQLDLNNQASDVMAQSHVALQLRYLQVANNFWYRHQGLRIIIFLLFQNLFLQTLNSISMEKNSTVVFPLPIDLFKKFFQNN